MLNWSMPRVMVSVRLETDLKEALEGIAKVQKRTLNNLLEVVLSDFAERANPDYHSGSTLSDRIAEDARAVLTAAESKVEKKKGKG